MSNLAQAQQPPYDLDKEHAERAEQVFEDLLQRNIKPSMYHYHALMDCQVRTLICAHRMHIVTNTLSKIHAAVPVVLAMYRGRQASWMQCSVAIFKCKMLLYCPASTPSI